MIEGDLKKLRLAASADAVRDRILGAAKLARKDSLVGRWICLAAVAAMLIAALAEMPAQFDVQSTEPIGPDSMQLAELIYAPELAPYLEEFSSPEAPLTEEGSSWTP
ncbi:MAG TPA: hypothetical protein VGK61_02580 [Planctomycetota bacterium]